MVNISTKAVDKKYKAFPNFSNAFDYVREGNKPERVVIIGNDAWKLYKLYPSGRADYIKVVPQGTGLTI